MNFILRAVFLVLSIDFKVAEFGVLLCFLGVLFGGFSFYVI